MCVKISYQFKIVGFGFDLLYAVLPRCSKPVIRAT